MRQHFKVGDKVTFQHEPGAAEHPCEVSWLKHPPVPGLVMVAFASGTRQWVGAHQLTPRNEEGSER